jgi:hypothetical protein
VMPQLLVTHPVMDHLTPPPDGVFLSWCICDLFPFLELLKFVYA